MEYTKSFACLDELNAFVNFHKEETGLLFFADLELKSARIEVDEKVCRELTHADR